jgi:hypothetical protein
MTKSALGIILVLGVFFLLAAGWGVYNFIELNRTQAELSVTESELLLTRTQRDDYAARLQSTQNSLTETEDELEETELELKANQAELKDTQQELTDIKFDLSAAELNTLILQNRYDQSQTELTAAVTTLDGLGITVAASSQCDDVVLVDNAAAGNPTLAELIDFINRDNTDMTEYILNVYDCSQFSRDFHNRAESAGIRTAEVQIDLIGGTYGHALNAVITSDFGLVYVDCTEQDTIARVVQGKVYRAVVPSQLSPYNIRNNSWWDGLSSYYYLPGDYGSDCITDSIIIYW